MEEHFFKFSQFSYFPELVHGISNRQFGDMRSGKLPEEEVVKNRTQFLKNLDIDIGNLVVPALAHGENIAKVDIEDRGKGAKKKETAIQKTDGLITRDTDVYLMVTVADCLPVLVYDPVLKIAGVFHAGWRGIVGQIIPAAVEKFQTLGSTAENLAVGVGPGICQKHFVVKNNVLSLFQDTYPSATLVRNNDGYVDLKKAVLIDLKKEGVSVNNIEISHICPACDNGIYGSYRKEGENVPAAAAVIGIRG